jgi:hypothetical protein
MNSSWIRRLIVLAAVALVASACSNFTPDNTGEFARANEIKPGPGIFTGEKGKWVIFQK